MANKSEQLFLTLTVMLSDVNLPFYLGFYGPTLSSYRYKQGQIGGHMQRLYTELDIHRHTDMYSLQGFVSLKNINL